jgi:capsular polysaccharide transport system permease protein
VTVYSFDDAITALRAGAYDRADEILGFLGGSKAGAASRLRILWAVAQILGRKFGDGIEAILEGTGRTANRTEPIYGRVIAAVGPFEEILPAAAAQELRLRIGDFFLREEKPEEAMLWLDVARKAVPDDPLAIYLHANCRFVLYGERQAVREMEDILDSATAETDRSYVIPGGTAALWYRIGLVHERMKDLESAAYYLATAVSLDPAADSQRLLLGDVLIRLGHFEEAIEQLGQIEKWSDGYRFAVRLRAVALFRVGESDAALALLEEAASLDPLGALTFLEMGRVYLARGDLEQAELTLARAFRINPELPGLKSAIVSLEQKLGRHLDPDAGLPQPTTFDIPDEFAPRPDDPALLEMPGVKAGLLSYLRVVHTLIVRDLFVVHAHSGMGYLWALLEPLAYVAAIAIVYTVAGHQPPLGTSVFAYLAAGIVPYITFYARVQRSVASAVASNVNLLYFREVTPLVLIASSAVREFLTSLVVFVAIVTAISFFDPAVRIDDPLTILLALTCISLLATVVGGLFGLGELAIPSLKLVETVLYRIMFFFSGALYYANLLPERMRHWALLNPLFHLIEFVRNGLFVIYHSHYATWHYPLAIIGIGLCILLVTLQATRRFVAAS